MRDKRRNIIVFTVLILAAGTVYKIPYLRAVFYDQMISSLGVTHTELGILSSVYAGLRWYSIFHVESWQIVSIQSAFWCFL